VAPDVEDKSTGYSAKNFQLLGDMEVDHFWFLARNEMISWLLHRYCADADRILELGCGTGFVSGALRQIYPNGQIAGCELHVAGMAIAWKRHGDSIEFFQADARSICLSDALDLVCAFDVLEHIDEDDAALHQIYSALVPGGCIIATVPQHPWLWSMADDVACHHRRYETGELVKKAQAEGFEIIYSDSYMALPLPLLALSRFRLGDKNTIEKFIDNEFRIPRALNWALLYVLRFEHVLRRHGIRYPVGGSQVLLARKPSEKIDA